VNSLTLKSAILLAGAALFCFGSSAARAENSVTFTGGYSTTFSNSDGHFGAGIHGTPFHSGIISDDYRNEITTDETWNGNAYRVSGLTASNFGEPFFGNSIGSSTDAQSYLGSLTNLWILTPNSHPGFGFKPSGIFIRGLNVPEGGAAILYLLLAGLSCFGALFLSRRKARTAQ